MAKKKEIYKVKPLNENKKNIIAALIEEYDIETADDIQEALKDLLGGTIKSMMESEMDEHPGYESYERSDNDNYRNETKRKTVRSNYGEFAIDVPQDRQSSFEPKIVKKRQKDISGIDQQIISMYARRLTTRQISGQIEEIYGFKCSEGFIPDVTDKILQGIEDWQNRPLDDICPVLFIDAVHFSVREDNRIKKLAAHVILAITLEGKKDVISLQIGENESSKYWPGVLNDLKNRGVKDAMVVCADGLTGIKEAIAAAFPDTEYQRCIVHQVRNTLKYVSYKDMKAFATDLKTIYLAPNEQQGYENMQRVKGKWDEKYPNAMKGWENNWDVLTPIFKFSSDVRKVIYTTNAIESLNSTYKKLNRQRTVFPSDKALLKALYLSTLQATKKWSQQLRGWAKSMVNLSSCMKAESRFKTPPICSKDSSETKEPLTCSKA